MFDPFRRHDHTLRSVEAVTRFIETWLEVNGAQIKGALLSTAWKEPPEANGTSFIVGKLLLIERHIPPRPRQLYPSVRLEESWIERDELAIFIGMLSSNEGNSILPVHFQHPNLEHIYSLHAAEIQSGWAEIQLKFTCHGDRTFPEWLPAVAPNHPPFQTWAQAVGTWVLNHSVTYGPDVPYGGQLVVVLPDTRARALAISQGNNGLELQVERNCPPTELEIQYLFSRSRVRLSHGVASIEQTTSIELPSDANATQLDIFCVHRTQGIISHRVFSWSELSAAGSVAQIEDRIFLGEIAGGERETVEFKPFVSADSEKIREIIKTVVAFLNTDGGRIYVGVNDDGRLQGRAGLKRYCSSKDPDGLTTALTTLRKIIHDNIKPVPEVRIRSYELAGEPVCIIEVPPGEAVYSTQDNEILIRKGSTNRKPDPASELEPLLARRRSGNPPKGGVEAEDVW